MPASPQALVGGQAVIEGVMMRAPGGVATAVRRPDGVISVRYRDYVPFTKRLFLLGWPVVRGAVTLIEALVLGTSSLTYSAEEAAREDGRANEPTPLGVKIGFGVVVCLSFVAGIGLFFYVPQVLTDLTPVEHGVAWNLVDGVIRLAIFFLYMFLVTRWKEMQRVFQYHGAEHMTIFNYEAEEPITVANSRDRPRLHPRCGTSFLFFVMIVSILVFATLGKPETVGERLIRIAFVPIIGGISYEVIRLSARYEKTLAGRWLAAPGMGLQLLTTASPDDSQLEVAVIALRAALSGGNPEREPVLASALEVVKA
ncbi:MAG: DUF1385 domain-containing protein [bacterium]